MVAISLTTLKKRATKCGTIMQVLIESGPMGHDCAAIVSHSPSIELMRPRNRGPSIGVDINVAGVANSDHETTVEGIVERVLNGVLCGKLKLRRYDTRKVLHACPGLFTTKDPVQWSRWVTFLPR